MSDVEIRAVYERLVQAWNDRNAEAFGEQFAEFGTLVGFDGSELSGRAEIERSIGVIFRDHETAKYVVAVRGVDTIDSEVAIVRAVAGLVPRGKTEVNAETNAIVRVVVVNRADAWLIAQLTNTPARFDGRPDDAKRLTAELQAIADRG